MGKIDINGTTVVFGGTRTKGERMVDGSARLQEQGLDELYQLFGEGEFSGAIRLPKPRKFVGMFPEQAVAGESPGLSSAELRQLICFAESIDGDHFTAMDLASSPEFFHHSAGYDLRRYPASARGFFGVVDSYRDPRLQGVPHFFCSITSEQMSYGQHSSRVGEMTSREILERLSQSLQPELAFTSDDAFIVTLDAIGGFAVLQRQESSRVALPGRAWWLQIILETREHISEAAEYCEHAERLGFHS